MRLGVAIAVWFSVVGAMTAPAAHADSKRADSKRADKKQPTPWSKGVSEAEQERALQLFQDGNEFFEGEKYTEAVAKYEQALKHWGNPNIHFNMAICLIHMRQPLVAWDHLQEALKFGDAPLGKHLYDEAERYVALLESSLAQLTVKSTQPEIKVMVDGAQVLDGPGEHSMKMLAGKHQLVASRPGYTTSSRALDLAAGKSDLEHIALELEKVKVERDNYERRWAWWAPWSVEAGAVVLALAATGVYLDARGVMANYDQAFQKQCPLGCTNIPSALQAQYDHARRISGVAIGMWVGAGAVAITGGVMAVLNRPIKVESRAVTPSLEVTRDHVGAGLSFTLE
jgi:tetratricopeptide (TPR) repeat protein